MAGAPGNPAGAGRSSAVESARILSFLGRYGVGLTRGREQSVASAVWVQPDVLAGGAPGSPGTAAAQPTGAGGYPGLIRET